MEELLFRGVLLRKARRFGDRTAVVFTAVMFGLMHGNLNPAGRRKRVREYRADGQLGILCTTKWTFHGISSFVRLSVIFRSQPHFYIISYHITILFCKPVHLLFFRHPDKHVTVHGHSMPAHCNRILPMLRIPNRQNPRLQRYHTEFSVPKIPN